MLERIGIAGLFIFIGVILTLLFRQPFIILKSRFQERAPVLKKYWKFVIPFSFLTTAAYVSTYKFAYSEVNIGIVGQASTLVLAIFAGYIAFSEFGEGKFDRVLEDARNALSRSEYNHATAKLQEAHSIKPKEIDPLGDLLELYLLVGRFEDFDVKINYYKRIAIEESHELVHLYLLALRNLFKEHAKEAKQSIKDAVHYVQAHPSIKGKFIWRIEECIKSDAFSKLEPRTQKMIVNLHAYLTSKLEAEEVKTFEAGKYDAKTSLVKTILPDLDAISGS